MIRVIVAAFLVVTMPGTAIGAPALEVLRDITPELLSPALDDRQMAALLNRIGLYYHPERTPRVADRYFRAALGIWERVAGPDHPETARVYGNLALVYESIGELREAERLQRRAIAILQADTGSGDGVIANVFNLAANLTFQKRYPEAEPCWQRALELAEEILPVGDARTRQINTNFAEFYRLQGRADKEAAVKGRWEASMVGGEKERLTSATCVVSKGGA